MSTAEAAEGYYLGEVASIAQKLRRLADTVDRLGVEVRTNSVNGQRPSRSDAVYEIDKKLREFTGLGLLWWYAIEADHASARLTPAQLLDQAATGVEKAMGDDLAHDPEELAEAALRGAGVLR